MKENKGKRPKTNAAFGDKSLRPSDLNDGKKKKEFKHGFGSVTRITPDETMPVYASMKLCMYYWYT